MLATRSSWQIKLDLLLPKGRYLLRAGLLTHSYQLPRHTPLATSYPRAWSRWFSACASILQYVHHRWRRVVFALQKCNVDVYRPLTFMYYLFGQKLFIIILICQVYFLSLIHGCIPSTRPSLLMIYETSKQQDWWVGGKFGIIFCSQVFSLKFVSLRGHCFQWKAARRIFSYFNLFFGKSSKGGSDSANLPKSSNHFTKKNLALSYRHEILNL